MIKKRWIHDSETLFYGRHAEPGFVRGSLARAQQQSEAVIAAEHLHQRALEGNGGIKMGTAGTYRRAECFFSSIFFFRQAIVPYVLHLRLSEPRAKHTAGQPPPSVLIGSCHGEAVSRGGGCAENLNMVFF